MSRDRIRPTVVPRAQDESTDPVDQRDDRVLVQAVRSGDEAAFRALYRRHSPRVYGFASRMLASEDDAEELVEDVFIAVWRRVASYDARRGEVIAWIFAMARSRVIDRLRRRARHPTSLSLAPDPAVDPADAVVTMLSVRAMRDGLASLNDDERAVLDACYYRGLSHSEAASYLGWPLGTVKTRSRTALSRLRMLLEAWRIDRHAL